MEHKLDNSPRQPGRKPQINIEVTESEKAYFGQVAEARGMKLAALVRELLNNEGKRLGAPALLADYHGKIPGYQYVVEAKESSTTKLGIFRQFLLKYESDCDFSISGYEPGVYNSSVECTAFSSSSKNKHKILIGIAADRSIGLSERASIDKAWHDVLGLSLNLEDKWDGVSYVVEKRRTINGKKLILKQFIHKYSDAYFSLNTLYAGKTIFKVVAKSSDSEHELLIAYLPERTGEATELQQAYEEYRQQNL